MASATTEDFSQFSVTVTRLDEYLHEASNAPNLPGAYSNEARRARQIVRYIADLLNLAAGATGNGVLGAEAVLNLIPDQADRLRQLIDNMVRALPTEDAILAEQRRELTNIVARIVEMPNRRRCGRIPNSPRGFQY